MREDDSEHRGVRAGVPVLFPAAAAGADIAEAGPLERAECLRVCAEPVEEAEIVRAESAKRRSVVHGRLPPGI
jgi:hypothetical protein